tara:strand:- start:154 stop:852 length:699 start_codon:yes stop_codon:yes gene_type:complete
MHKILIALITSFILPSITLELGNVSSSSAELLITSTVEIRGFQIDLNGFDLTGGSGGLAEQNGFDIHAAGDTVLGFSLDGSVIPAGSGVLTVLEGTIDENLCIPFVQGVGPEDDTPIFADQDGSALVDISIGTGSCEALSNTEDLSFNIFDTYPNPFNPNLNINVQIENTEHIDISVFNINGQLINMIHSGILTQHKLYNFVWDATNYSSGIYLISIESNNFSKSKLVNLLK